MRAEPGGLGDPQHRVELLARPHAPAAHVRGLLDAQEASRRRVAVAGPRQRAVDLVGPEHPALPVER